MNRPTSPDASPDDGRATAVSGATGLPPAPTWDEFEGHLAATLARMAVDTYLILTTPANEEESSYYVQFAQGGKAGFRAEAVSNAYLAGTYALSPAQEEQLGDLGWQWPPPRSRDELNFSRQWPMPTPFEEVARLAVRTLREVYGVGGPSRLVYRRFARGGPDFAEPDLGIDAEVPTAPRRQGQPVAPTLAELTPLVESALKAFLNVDELVRDRDGDIPVRMGSAIVFVRTREGTPPMVQVFSPILHGIDSSPGLLDALNEVNSRIHFARVFWAERSVVVAADVSAIRITADHVAFACLQLGSLADHLDDELRERFGGSTAFPTERKLLN
jgi:T3SS (YopN, CesT) and YbjN peptide-binding chaperone 1/T3SS (YopN, CesT) and YbjN peptide-binding chaperone 3